MTVENLYERYIKQLPVHDRLRLMAMVANDLTATAEPVVHRISPRLANPSDAADFVMEVVPEQEPDARV